MITLTRPESRYILEVARPLIERALPSDLAIELADRYNAIEVATQAESDEDIEIDFPLFPISIVKQQMNQIGGKYFIGAMRKLFDFEN